MNREQQQLRLFVDRVIGSRYRIVTEIGRGGMGAVFEAIDLTSNRHVAIKQTSPSDASLMAAAKREASLLRDLNYPQCPRLLDQCEEETGLFLVMQFFSGPTLGQLLATRKLPFPAHQVKLWAKDLLHTLAYLHGRNPAIVHHDIKPSNLKLLPDGSVALLDFGLAQPISQSKGDQLSDALLAYTPSYAPPEQITGERTAEYSDIYALGATLYHLLTGRAPADSLKRSRQVRSCGVDPLEPIDKIVRGVPQILAQLITKALSLEPSQRPTSALEMVEQLSANIPIFTPRRPAQSAAALSPKPAVLSGHRDRITVEIPSCDLRQRQVISLAAFREEKEREAALRRKSATTLVNIASTIAILFTVASLTTFVFRNAYGPPPITSRDEAYAAGKSLDARADQLNARSITIDELIRWRSRTSKHERRSTRNYAHTSTATGTLPLPPATAFPAF